MISPDAPRKYKPTAPPFTPPAAPRHTSKSSMSAHTPGTSRGETRVREEGPEPGRDDPRAWRVSRDSTAVNPRMMEPIDRRMPHIPPA